MTAFSLSPSFNFADTEHLGSSAKALTSLAAQYSAAAARIPTAIPANAWHSDASAAVGGMLSDLHEHLVTTAGTFSKASATLSGLETKLNGLHEQVQDAQRDRTKAANGTLLPYALDVEYNQKLQGLCSQAQQAVNAAAKQLDGLKSKASYATELHYVAPGEAHGPGGWRGAWNWFEEYGGIALGGIAVGGSVIAAFLTDGLASPLAVGSVGLEGELFEEEGAGVGLEAGSIGPIVDEEAGGPGGWNWTLSHPAADTMYDVDGQIYYETDAYGRTVRVSGEIDSSSVAGNRNPYWQLKAGGADRLDGDDGGHLVATRLGGPGEGINITAMSRALNRAGPGSYYEMEQQWVDYAAEGSAVAYNIEVVMAQGSSRALMFVVIYTVDNGPEIVRVFDNTI
ncbi:MAG: DNA/RNA non-specific endonuclease [Actinomycetota bacterium]|nr:DNA/RNA non-specific endonuclease [Actinomycetota bacterium]